MRGFGNAVGRHFAWIDEAKGARWIEFELSHGVSPSDSEVMVSARNLKRRNGFCQRNVFCGGFGPYATFGTIVKDFRNARMPYTPSEIVGSQPTGIRRIRDNEVRTVCTSHVERNNVTIRTFMKRFARLTLGFSKKLENLSAAVAVHMAHYNFCRVHSSIRKTPALAAQVTNDVWTLEELFDKALQCE